MPEAPPPAPTGDELPKVLSALGNPHRMRIVAALLESRNYVSALARLIDQGRIRGGSGAVRGWTRGRVRGV
ncbi:hypothetical protein GCM10010310_05500 [Streptomyces violaceolatus]|uniref:HTH arsR-type domain-containing protein n=1 Tax=Streptomyces violaceolatus TaxID=67378 RepID=A0ABN3S5R2_9ACTN|nr:hypothetical protein GCM10010391_04750 [Streptomyces anthocyanicus]